MEDPSFVAFSTASSEFGAAGRLLEIAAVKVLHGKIVERWERLVQPDTTVSLPNVFCPLLTSHLLTQGQAVGVVLGQFLDFCKGLPLVTHNASYQVRLISAEALRCGIPLPRNIMTCTLAQARTTLPGLDRHTLEYLAGFFSVPHTEPSRALAAAETIASIHRELRQWAATDRVVRTWTFQDLSATLERIPAHLKALRTAMERGEAIQIIYDGGTKGLKQRPILPTALYEEQEHLYIEGYCMIDSTAKTYRLDRIREIHDAARESVTLDRYPAVNARVATETLTALSQLTPYEQDTWVMTLRLHVSRRKQQSVEKTVQLKLPT